MRMEFLSFGLFMIFMLISLCRCKKYPSMELRGLFQYLVNQLKRGQGIELVLLQVMYIFSAVFILPCLFSKWIVADSFRS